MSKKAYRVRGKYLDDQGRCIVSFNHSMIPVPGLLPGELAEIALVHKGRETLGSVTAIIEPSKDRMDEGICPYFGQCGGCQLQHMSYKAQLEYKRAQVEALMGKEGAVQEILGMETPLCYRHKIHGTFGFGQRGRIISGIYAPHSHRLLDLDGCKIIDPAANEILTVIRDSMKRLGISPYDEDKRRGQLRHVLIRTGYKTGQIMVVFVLATLKFPQGKALSELLLKRFPQIVTIVYNRNDKKTSMVLGEEERIVYGPGYVEDELCGLRFRISPKSFYQVNPVQTQVLYEKAMELAAITREDQVLDTYCGIGTISLLAAKYAGEVTGVELNPQAVADAKVNARLNDAKNVRFVCEDATAYMAHSPYYDVIIMDPPRSGSTPAFLKAAAKLSPERIVYISCNPQTQARDLKLLKPYGYKVKEIQPVDMFPMTTGIENIVLLRRS